ncbi:MAG TPA: mechanosensitive ion channel family protein [Acidimicrobiia bacterium]|jgi:small conductance mechanosensitive channel|nr:mechanosensitive ion channel family protein [Acidimicrobiia bacterium]
MARIGLFAQVVETTRESLIATGVIVVAAAVVYWAVGFLGRRFVERVTARFPERGSRATTLWTVLRRVILIAVLFLAVLFVFSVWGWSLAPFIGLGTIFAAAIGFGAQDLVKDFLSGFFILLEDQFHIGDVVTIAETSGTVEDIQLRVTVLRDYEGNVHFVPNGQIKVTSNFTSKFAQPVIDVRIPYETDVDRAIEVFEEELRSLADDPRYGPMITEVPEVLGVNELHESAVILRGRFTTVADTRWDVRREALRRVKKRFDAEGISIPYPQVTINRKE